MHQSFPGRGICTAISKVCKVTDTVQQPLVTCAEDSGWNNQTPYTTKTAQKTSQSVSFPPSCKIKIVGSSPLCFYKFFWRRLTAGSRLKLKMKKRHQKIWTHANRKKNPLYSSIAEPGSEEILDQVQFYQSGVGPFRNANGAASLPTWVSHKLHISDPRRQSSYPGHPCGLSQASAGANPPLSHASNMTYAC